MQIKWECIEKSVRMLPTGDTVQITSMARSKVPGGWLIEKNDCCFFYPDANHEWNLEEEPVNGA